MVNAVQGQLTRHVDGNHGKRSIDTIIRLYNRVNTTVYRPTGSEATENALVFSEIDDGCLFLHGHRVLLGVIPLHAREVMIRA